MPVRTTVEPPIPAVAAVGSPSRLVRNATFNFLLHNFKFDWNAPRYGCLSTGCCAWHLTPLPVLHSRPATAAPQKLDRVKADILECLNQPRYVGS